MAVRQVVEIGGLRLAYQEHGQPSLPVAVLLHALGQRAADWALVVARLAERFRVFALDLRGHGDSDRPGIYSLRLMRDDVLGFFDALALGSVTLVGHSMGGAVAYLIAMAAPDLVQRLIVEDASPPYRHDRPIPVRLRPQEPVEFDWAVVPAIVGEVNAGDPQAWAGLASITAPTLIIGGGRDSTIPQDMLAKAAARIPRCDLLTIAAGHHVHENRPREFTDALLDWLDATL